MPTNALIRAANNFLQVAWHSGINGQPGLTKMLYMWLIEASGLDQFVDLAAIQDYAEETVEKFLNTKLAEASILLPRGIDGLPLPELLAEVLLYSGKMQWYAGETIWLHRLEKNGGYVGIYLRGVYNERIVTLNLLSQRDFRLHPSTYLVVYRLLPYKPGDFEHMMWQIPATLREDYVQWYHYNSEFINEILEEI